MSTPPRFRTPSSHPCAGRPSSSWCVWISDTWRPPIRTSAASGWSVAPRCTRWCGTSCWPHAARDTAATSARWWCRKSRRCKNCWECPTSVRSLRYWLSASRRDKSPSCTARPLTRSLRGSASTGRPTHSLTNLAATRTAAKRAVPARDSPDAKARSNAGSFLAQGAHPQTKPADCRHDPPEGTMTRNASVGEVSVLSKELRLSNGVTLSNRIAQSAMTEHLATGDGAPSWQLIEAYKRFAVSGAALIISGNVMVNGWSLEAPRNVVIEDERHLPQLRRWAASTTGSDARLILQLSLAGRQSQRGLALAGRRQDVATASAVPMSIGGPLFKPPRALSDLEIRQIIGQFATAARIAAEAGFAGVQVHAAHGYLLSQFLSPLVNRRTDSWGGSAEKRMRMLIEIVRAVGSVTPQSFLLTVKMNVSDFQPGGFDAAEALAVAKALENEGVHLIEFSGGIYESSAMIDGGVASDPSGAREAYFLSYAKEFAQELSVP